MGSWTVICSGDSGTRVVTVPPFVADKPPDPGPGPGPEPEPEPVPGKPYDEAFYLSTAAPMATGDPSGATAQATADYAVMNRPVDGQYAIWFTRTEHDYQNGLKLPDSWKKHRNELRKLLNPAGDKLPTFP